MIQDTDLVFRDLCLDHSTYVVLTAFFFLINVKVFMLHLGD